MTPPDCENLHRACILHPEEDTPRLMLSDWYAEHDHAAFAAALRRPGFWRVNADDLLAWVDRFTAAETVFGLWPWEGEPLPSCCDCRLNGVLDLRPDPYKEEICDETVYGWRCEECRDEKLQDI